MDSGLVLQVGAMKLEDNASALAQDLRKKKFPAMVFRHGNDKLYRVAVGPYSDADSTAKVKEQLEKQGFKPLLQRWAGE
jgi:cell division septation protein DedD